jgi:peptidoglycan hydrolase-like protein with peptidoglycan-binding domain
MNRESIKNLQYRLRKVLNISLSIDGDYGPSTTRAFKSFQASHDLYMDGIAGAKTLTKLHLV